MRYSRRAFPGLVPHTVLSPDAVVILNEQVPRLSMRGMIRVIPPLVAEVLSPSNRPGEINEKGRIYLGSGVRVVWVIDPERRRARAHTPDGAVRTMTETDELVGADVLPGFRLPLSRLFRNTNQFGR